MSQETRTTYRDLVILHKLGAIKSPVLRAKVDQLIESDPVAMHLYESLDEPEDAPSPAMHDFMAAVKQRLAIDRVVGKLISQALDTKVESSEYKNVREVELSGSGVDRVVHHITAAGDGRSNAVSSQIESVEKRMVLSLSERLLRVTYPKDMLPNGLAWIIWLSDDNRMSRHLIPLQMMFGAWSGSLSINLSSQQMTEVQILVVPVTEDHLRLPETKQEIRRFLDTLPSCLQRTQAEDFLNGLDEVEDL